MFKNFMKPFMTTRANSPLNRAIANKIPRPSFLQKVSEGFSNIKPNIKSFLQKVTPENPFKIIPSVYSGIPTAYDHVVGGYRKIDIDPSTMNSVQKYIYDKGYGYIDKQRILNFVDGNKLPLIATATASSVPIIAGIITQMMDKGSTGETEEVITEPIQAQLETEATGGRMQKKRYRIHI